MININPHAGLLGATVTGIDLSEPLSNVNFGKLFKALGDRGVLHFPNQLIDAVALKRFSERFGSLQIIKGVSFHEPDMPEVTILSNVVENGRAIGLADAGQEWHTDMTYNPVVGFINVLVAHRVPVRDGKVLGATEFASTQAAFEELPDRLKRKLEGATATHDLNFYWEYMRREKGSTRPPLTPEQRAARPPVVHPVLLRHPISGRQVIYVNPGFTECINGMPREESDALLAELYAHVLQPRFRYDHRWSVGDVLMWDHLGTWHNAVADYRADEPRLMKRCQVLADKVFDPDFTREALAVA
jgi:taurine dioxygenase